MYMLYSHKNSLRKIGYLFKNLFLSRHIRDIHSEGDLKKLNYNPMLATGDPGSVLLSDQYGYHGGTEQDLNKGFRILLVLYWSNAPRSY